LTSLGALAPWLADALVILGIAVMTLGVYGIIWMPDVYNKLHAASKVVFLGVISLLVATAATGDPAFIYRLVVIGAFLLLTTPVSAHVIGRAAYLRQQRMEAPDAVDESGRDLSESVPAED
jgi:multicomponent Na+:H+ antiporter subunit G